MINITHYYGNSVSSQITNQVLTDTENDIQVYYSYGTIIAVRIKGKLTIAKNIWKTIAAKHLNAIDKDETIRVDYEEVQKAINSISVSLKDD